MRALLFAASVALCLFLTACSIPLSKTPLSDQNDSEIDERLIGTWEVDVRPVHEKLGNRDAQPTERYQFTRTDESENGLRCVHLRGEENEGKPLPFFTTHLGMHDYFSLATQIGDDNVLYSICRYELESEERGRFYLMDDQFIIDQIDSGKVAGRVDRGGEGVQGVMLNLDPEKLREFVRRHGDKVFDMKHPLACKRIKPSIAQE